MPPTGANAGDTDGERPARPGEEWQFSCQQEIQTPASTDPAGQNIDNTADAVGTDPDRHPVTDTATDDVDAFNPAIILTKLVNGQRPVTILSRAATLTYTYAATNTGNTPLGTSTLDRRHPAVRRRPTRGPDDPGNDDDVLDVGETWTYSCTAHPTRPSSTPRP